MTIADELAGLGPLPTTGDRTCIVGVASIGLGPDNEPMRERFVRKHYADAILARLALAERLLRSIQHRSGCLTNIGGKCDCDCADASAYLRFRDKEQGK